MRRLLAAGLVIVAVIVHPASAADGLSRQQIAKAALDWLLFDDRGVQPPAGQAAEERPVDERTAYIRGHLVAQPEVRVIFSDSDHTQVSAVYDVSARSFRSAGHVTATSGGRAGVLTLSIQDRPNYLWRVKFTPSDGDGLSGPVAEITQHSGGYYARYAGYRIVCP